MNPNFYLHLALAAFFAFILIIALKIWHASREDCREAKMAAAIKRHIESERQQDEEISAKMRRRWASIHDND